MYKKTEYVEISKAMITESREAVISTCSKGGYTLAQRMQVQDGNSTVPVFLKGAFHIDDLGGLYDLRDALNLAIKKVEDGDAELDEWDE